MTLTTSTPRLSITRGDVWWVDFDPSKGQEQRKQRPAVVMNPASVGRLRLHIVVPITSWQPHFASHFWLVYLPADTINNLPNDSAADAFQVRSLSEIRFVNKIGILTPAQMDDISAAVAVCVGYTPPSSP